nr:acyl-CoA dehydrogenase [Aerococcus mictus]
MDIELTKEDEAFRAEVRRFISEKLPKELAEKDTVGASGERSALKRWQKDLYEKGWVAVNWPKQHGGTGWTPMQKHIFNEEMAAANAPRLSPFGLSMVGPVIYTFGNEDHKKQHLAGILTGDVWWCQGYSEPGSGSDLASLQTKAHEDGDDFVINGQKIWTSTAHAADMIFCLVRTEPDKPKHEGISYLIFSMKTPGIEVRPLTTMTGHAEFNEVFFTDVRVPKTQIVGGRGQGWFVANATLKHERGMLGDPNQAGTRLKEIIALMNKETLDGQRLIDNPLFRDRLLQLQARVLAMQFHGLRLLTAATKGEDAGLARLIVKLQGCELNHQLAALAIDALGELGVLYGDSPHLRDDGSWQHRYMFDLGLIIGGGTAQIQKNIISERGLNMPREPKPAKV